MLLSGVNPMMGLYAVIDGTAVYDAANDIGTEEQEGLLGRCLGVSFLFGETESRNPTAKD